jgi:hypothetical protein
MDGGTWMSRPRAAAVTGIMFAAVAQFLSFGLGGAGHGWVEPFFFGAAMWITLPVMAIRLSRRAAGSDNLDWVVDGLVFLSGLLLDGLLVISTVFGTGTEYFLKVVAYAGPLVALWIALWLSWQIAALFLLSSGLRRKNSIEG